MFALNTTTRPTAMSRSGAARIALSCQAVNSIPPFHTFE